MRGWDSPIQVLHVDDEPDVATLTAEYLERESDRMDVVTATGASEALDLLDEGVDCVVSDQEMPEMTGIELLERVRDRFPDLPFVLFTGQGSEEVASRAISAGVTDYLQKETGTDQYTILANRVTNAVNQYRAQQAVADNERRLRNVLDQIPHPVFVIDADERYLLSNEAHAASHGCTVSEVEGEHAADILEESFYEAFSVDLARVFESGEVVHKPEIIAETPDGTRYYDSRIHPFENFRPESRAALGVVVDVTERKRREQALERLHEGTRDLVGAKTKAEVADLVVDGVSETLGNRKVLVRLLTEDGSALEPVAISSEAREMLGDRPVYEVGEGTAGAAFAEGETLLIDDVQQIDDEYGRGDARASLYVPIGRHGTLSIGETEVGVFDQWDVHLAEVFAANAAVALDLVEQAHERQRQNDRLEEFASIVSHDLRNPLNVLSVTLDLIEQEEDPAYVERCRRSVARMERLIEDLLALARDGTVVAETEPLALDEVAADSWDAVPTGEAELRIVTDAVVHADPDRLRQFLENLFRNSVEHGSTDGDGPSTGEQGASGGGVTVTVEALEDGFAVEDDGPGIPLEERERVFESGYSTADRGTGLGLAIVDRIADAHGWEVTLTGGPGEDSGSSGGTRFEVTGVEIDS
jgi:PAS domain S-box-containing protein